jgi:hypothetical protein
MDRQARSDLHQGRSRITRRSGSTEAVECFNMLTSAALLETTEALLPMHRKRLYPRSTALSICRPHTLEAAASCRNAVNGWAAQRAAAGLRACSGRIGRYCKVRRRSPLAVVSALRRHTGHFLSQQALPRRLWRRRAAKRADRTGLSMPDTLREPDRVSPAQYAGHGDGDPAGAADQGYLCGRRCSARYSHQAPSWHRQWRTWPGGSGARGPRSINFRRGQSLGPRDVIARWRKPTRQPLWLAAEP